MLKLINSFKKMRSKILASLLIVSLLMTSSTFAYWTSTVQGNEYTHSSYITIGEYGSIDDFLFLLSTEYTTGDYQANNIEFFNYTQSTHSFTETFQAEWISESAEEFDDTIVTADVEFDYVIRILDASGAEVNRNKYNRLIDYISVEFDQENATELVLNAAPETLGFTLHITEPTRNSDYSQLSSLTVSVVISYQINGTTQELIYTTE